MTAETADDVLMIHPRMPRLPSVLVLQLVAGMVVCIPFALMTRTTIDETARRLQAAEQVEAGVATVDDRLELAAALAAEATATSAVIVIDALPEPIASSISADLDGSLVLTREAVDEAMDRADDGSYRSAVDGIRSEVDSGKVEHNDAVGALLEVGATVGHDLRMDLLVLSGAIGGMSGGEQIARNLDAARSAVELSVLASDATARWGGIVSPTDPPTSAEVERFVGSVAMWRDAQDVFEITLDIDSSLTEPWRTLRDDDSHQTVDLVFTDTIRSLSASPPDVVPPADTDPDDADADPDDADPDARIELTPELIADLQVVNEVVDALETVVVESYALAEGAIVAVTDENAVVQADASAARTRATILLVASVALVLVASGGLAVLVVRPLRRLGSAASALSRGELEARAPESGPSELRTTATALNQALGALERAEMRAHALAEERPFDDEVEGDESGPLSSSIDAAVLRLANVMSERELLRRKLEYDAGHDGLTGLANRGSVIAHLERVLVERRGDGFPCALLYLDFDEFKSINDEFGHHVGDEILRIAAARLRQCLGELDVGGRIGGDEIVVIAPQVTDIAAALAQAERIRLALSAPLTIDSVSLAPSVSVGVSIADRPDVDADQLIGEADLALYRAKELGRGRVELCDEGLRRTTSEISDLGRAVDRALANDEFELHYQPIFDIRSGRLYAVEALLRWRRNGIIVAPDEFIPHAERSGQIVAIDHWVLRAAAEQAAVWDDDPRLGNVPISINLSGRSVSNPALAHELDAAVHTHGIAPSRLMVEVTENSVLDDLDSVVHQLTSLRAVGVRIALDDFGTGYMSLATLRRFDIDVLKIDRSFVSQLHEPTDRSLVELMIHTAHVLDVDVVAEGVETTSQQELLEQLGVDALQGFLFAVPAPPERFLADLTSGTLRFPAPRTSDALDV